MLALLVLLAGLVCGLICHCKWLLSFGFCVCFEGDVGWLSGIVVCFPRVLLVLFFVALCDLVDCLVAHVVLYFRFLGLVVLRYFLCF